MNSVMHAMKRVLAQTNILVAVMAVACGGGNTPPQGGETAPGADPAPKTAALESGANLLQDKAPVEKIAMYLNGFHLSKDNPKMQMEAHHYCNQANEGFTQCVLFDGNTEDARLMGIEYIVSEKLYNTLPAEEKAYWHPHNYEVLSGTLRMPGLPDAAEKQALATKINSYGKTWHVWMTGTKQSPGDALPLGPAHLAWSFNADGEAKPGLVEDMASRLKQDVGEKRRSRAELAPLARPQEGVDALASRFPGRGGAPEGVRDKNTVAGRTPAAVRD